MLASYAGLLDATLDVHRDAEEKVPSAPYWVHRALGLRTSWPSGFIFPCYVAELPSESAATASGCQQRTPLLLVQHHGTTACLHCIQHGLSPTLYLLS